MFTERGRWAEVLFPTALVVALVVSLSGCTDESESPAGAGAGGGGVGAAGGAGGSGGASPVDVLGRLQAIPGVVSVEEGPPKGGARYFDIEIEQPADHDAPEGQQLIQRIGLIHRDFDAPMVLASTGYGLGSAKLREPALLVNGNQLTVEHRFFTPSRPDPADWHHLRIRQAAADHHRIVEVFKEVYPARWLSTGASKGGMTSVYHRRFFPDDVHGTIAYVAPQSYGDADPRYVTFLEQVGSPECRDALKAFQGEALLRRPALTAAMVAELGESGYLHLGVDGALDFAVIELPFAFWQYMDPGLCAAIPGAAATDEEVWAFLNAVDPPELWGDELFEYYEPYYFQAAVELGYPAYDDSHLAGLLSVPQGFDVAVSLVEPGPTKEMVLDEGAMLDVADWLSAEGERMLFVYGEFDPYSAAAFEPGGAAESARLFVPGGNHGALISDLGPADQAAALELVSAWAGVAKMPPPSPELLEEARERRPPGR